MLSKYSIRSKLILGITASIFVVACTIVLGAAGSHRAPKYHGKVLDLLPKSESIDGWTLTYESIAETPEMQRTVNEQLNFDDAVFAIYRRAGISVSVYIAYWRPGKMPARMIASHTPDTCWVYNGWRKLSALRSGPLRIGPTALPAGEVRVMSINAHVENVIFWHMADGKSKSYQSQGLPPWHAIFSDIFADGLAQKPEQFFIRISTNCALETIVKEPLFIAIIDSLRPAFQ